MQPRYHHQVVGINSRLDTLQAAVLNVKLKHLEEWTADRQANARRYDELFTAARPGSRRLALPLVAAHGRHVWNQYVIRVPHGRRDALRDFSSERKIGTEIYYPVPLHLQECFHSLGYSRRQPAGKRTRGPRNAGPADLRRTHRRRTADRRRRRSPNSSVARAARSTTTTQRATARRATQPACESCGLCDQSSSSCSWRSSTLSARREGRQTVISPTATNMITIMYGTT